MTEYSDMTESSGILLLRLVNTRIFEITKKELRNTDRLCLYGTGGWWTAFERSAYHLSRLFPDSQSFAVTPPGCPFTIIGLSVSGKELNKYMKKHPADRQGVDYLEFSADTLDTKDYDAWHLKVENGFKEAVEAPAEAAGSVS